MIEIGRPDCPEHELPMSWIGGEWWCFCCIAKGECDHD